MINFPACTPHSHPTVAHDADLNFKLHVQGEFRSANFGAYILGVFFEGWHSNFWRDIGARSVYSCIAVMRWSIPRRTRRRHPEHLAWLT